jgi:hypothetical protein
MVLRVLGVQNGIDLLVVLSDYFRMKKKDLTPKQLSAVDCPTCGVSAGRRCILEAGGLRSTPHVSRKLAAAEAIEAKAVPQTRPR